MIHRLENLFDTVAEWRRELVGKYYRFVDGLEARRNVKAGAGQLRPEQSVRIALRETRVPDGVRVYAIGDVHGRADLLQKLYDKIKSDLGENGAPGEQAAIVFLGDYIDRGFQSRDVIEFLSAGAFDGFEPRFLKGNHEEAFLKFLDDASIGPKWAEFGGRETLVSYQVQPPRLQEDLDDWERARRELVDRMPTHHRSFLDNLEVCLTLGDYVFVHAGLKPGLALEDQSEKDLLWIRDEFLYDKDPFKQVVVHGHTPIAEPHRDFRRISVDTGAYMSGKLTAACLFEDKVTFIST